MTAPIQTPRRRGAQPGNANRLLHGRYSRTTRLRARQLRAWVSACRFLCRQMAVADAGWTELKRSSPSKKDTRLADARMAIAVFKCLRNGLKMASELEVEALEAESHSSVAAGADAVQIRATTGSGPVHAGEGL